MFDFSMKIGWNIYLAKMLNYASTEFKENLASIKLTIAFVIFVLPDKTDNPHLHTMDF